MAQYPDAARGKTREDHLLVLKARLDNMELVPEQQGKWGFIPLAGYEEIQRLGLELGTIKARQDLAQIMTNELSDRINTFDPEQVRQQARAVRPWFAVPGLLLLCAPGGVDNRSGVAAEGLAPAGNSAAGGHGHFGPVPLLLCAEPGADRPAPGKSNRIDRRVRLGVLRACAQTFWPSDRSNWIV